MTLST